MCRGITISFGLVQIILNVRCRRALILKGAFFLRGEKMEPLSIIWNLDFSHRFTTARMHCLELFMLCRTFSPRSVLELGAGYGVSGVAIGLGSGVHSVVVDDESIKREVPISLWERFGVEKQYVKANANKWLNENDQRFDFVYHDADHGPRRIPDYRKCWQLTGKVLAIHDVDRIDFEGFVRDLSGVAEYWKSWDQRGRALGVVIRDGNITARG